MPQGQKMPQVLWIWSLTIDTSSTLDAGVLRRTPNVLVLDVRPGRVTKPATTGHVSIYRSFFILNCKHMALPESFMMFYASLSHLGFSAKTSVHPGIMAC